ncbi:hypothetical protein TNCV_2695211 [Trichonephila clavipes]|nr:hypothetical protein TNCV_2695211 [Trichonephila clavipes]
MCEARLEMTESKHSAEFPVIFLRIEPLAFPNLGCVDRRYTGPHEWERRNGLQLEGQKGRRSKMEAS